MPLTIYMNIKCDYCGVESDNNRSYKTNFCNTCVKDKEFGFPYMKQTVMLKGYGSVSVKRLGEIESRTMLPIKRTDGKSDYYVGKKLKNGKILESMPDARN